jgi:hypothetical protein
VGAGRASGDAAGARRGDASDADVVLVAVPGGSIVEALENAARQEAIIDVIFAIKEGMGEYVYRFAPIEQL